MKTSPVAAALALLVALVLGTAFATPALAHDRLKSSSPAKDAKVERLEEVKLTFSASVRFPNVVVRSGDTSHQDGKPSVDGAVVTQKVKAGLPPGRYVIAYRVVSSDGHPIEGEIPFTLVGQAASSPSSPSSPSQAPEASESSPAGAGPGSATESATESATASAPATPSEVPVTPAAAAEESGSSGGVPGWMWIVVGALTGVGIGMFFSMRGKKRP
ncbi:copper resistance protein CopC [Streptosporangium sp. NPDC050855]|uniref:copper resistance protein CopC n=1 Tax=Streptosporangium sp. NPDC050855 TaxID=3366194 RepID=UPI0037A2CF43